MVDGSSQRRATIASPISLVVPVSFGLGAGRTDAVGLLGLAEVVNIIAPLRMAAMGLLAGADDVGRRAVDRLEHRHAVRVQVGGGARPIPPETAPPRSVRMSPKRLSVTITSYR